jgi:hypothetical protein
VVLLVMPLVPLLLMALALLWRRVLWLQLLSVAC